VKKKSELIPDRWTFKSDAIAEGFDAHVREQLPWYELATGAMAHAARHFIQRDGMVIDLGASTGNVERAISGTLRERNADMIAVDDSADMLARYRGGAQVMECDICAFEFPPCDLVVSFLCLMFLPVAERAKVLSRAKEAVRPGGGVILVEKIQPPSGYVGTISLRLALAAKFENGASAEDVIRKELSLAGVQRPLYAAELDGFQEFFRFGDFAGYIFDKGA
jgi:tRNA (cmo5U34)-methyltransferase